jgi:hypothetical protein
VKVTRAGPPATVLGRMLNARQEMAARVEELVPDVPVPGLEFFTAQPRTQMPSFQNR